MAWESKQKIAEQRQWNGQGSPPRQWEKSDTPHHLYEHRRALKNGDLGSSALAEHVFSANHQVDLSKAMVIDTHNHTQTRCMLESWHIQHHQSPLNREKGTLPGLYASLLPDRASIWRNPIFALLLLLVFSFLSLFSFIFNYLFSFNFV